MNWFNNLNAMPRLLLSFGVLILLLAQVSFLAVTGLSHANDRIDMLYKRDMKGLEATDDVVIARLSMGREARDAILNINDAAIVAEDNQAILANLQTLKSSLDELGKLTYTAEGSALLAAIQAAMPEYERAFRVLMERTRANDSSGARSALLVANSAGASLFRAADRFRDLKLSLGEKKYQANAGQYQATRAGLLTVATIATIIGFLLSLLVARGFSRPLALTMTALHQLAAGDLTAFVEVSSRDEVGRMAAALNTAIAKLRAALQEVAQSAHCSNSSSQQLAAAAEEIASGAQQQAASLEETSASLEQITAAVRQTADNARQASQVARGSRESAEKGQEVVASAIAAMTEINVASAKISDIIATINEIAFQTNLLAVNAAVEAARAGEEGRGFAVVASEVRSLAQRSADASKEIRLLIQDSLEKVEKGCELVNGSGETLQGIVGSVKRVTELVGEIAAASSEQSTGVEQVNAAVTQMDQITQTNSAQTEELASTAQSFAEQAARLTHLVNRFKVDQGHEAVRNNNDHAAPEKASAGAGTVSRARGHLRPVAAMAGPVAKSSSDADFEEF